MPFRRRTDERAREAAMARAVINNIGAMGRWEPDARGRLAQAALELYAQRGFENTTVAEIAKRAGLTERTFFRHFTDKREVLFGGGDVLEALLVEAVETAPPEASPTAAVALALQAAAAMFQERRDFARQRQAIIAATPELLERELIKLASLSAALAAALRRRGVGDPAASLVAEAAIAVFRVSFETWVRDPGSADLGVLMQEGLDGLAIALADRTPVG
jgi:AcrR family transcriptional regulator